MSSIVPGPRKPPKRVLLISRRCAIPDCGASSGSKLMCLSHWQRVPFSVQFEVYRAWAHVKQAFKKDDMQALVTATEAYRLKRQLAINAVLGLT